MVTAFHESKTNSPLARLEVLAVDCQATTTNPEKGRLLEIGFMAGSAARAVNAAVLEADEIKLLLS